MTASTDTPDKPEPPQRTKNRTGRVIGALILREMSTTYGRSPGGYVWAVLEPVAAITMMAVGLSLLFRAPSLGTSFLLFYAGGLLPLRYYQNVSQSVGTAIQFNRPLMAYSRVTYMDTIIARAMLAILTQTMVVLIVFGGLFVTQDIRENIDVVPILEGFLLCIVLGVGLGTFNCFMFLRFAIWKSIWGILTRPLLLISGVFYIYEDLPRIVQNILWFNPLIHISGIVRSGIYSTYDPAYVSQIYVAMFGVIPMVFGLLLLWRFWRDLLQR
ncbi:ABC transporter permease [uncultured Roseovarius sp.]|uniref:ABC transporter permease n=1 Tax=uncultured Roseovarius sp. TaxID=293344 RepID=UPI00260AFED5|nr:ABC transporter permease [uncultured Roseovarius sp.]